jgi:hypothetical protein
MNPGMLLFVLSVLATVRIHFDLALACGVAMTGAA